MKKMLFIAVIWIAALLTAFPAVYADNDTTTLISSIELVDYILYAGVAIFLLGMIFLLLALFFKKNAAEIDADEAELDDSESAELADYENEAYDEESDEEFDDEEIVEGSLTADDIDTEEDDDDFEKAEDLYDDGDDDPETSQNDDVSSLPEGDFADDTDASDELTADDTTDAEDETEEEATEESVRITFTGINTSDLKILEFNGSATIGRKSSNDLMIADNAVSGLHCRIYSEDDKIYIEDLGSTNGTLVNGVSVIKEELKSNDTLILGKTHFRIAISK